MPVAGVEAVPGPVTLVVSAGSGLEVKLARALTPANQTIGYTVVATDLNGSPVTPPTGTTAVTAIGATQGALPAVSAGKLVPSQNTRGRFRLTVTGGGVTATADFVVLTEPSTAQAPSQLDEFVRVDEVLEQMDRLLAEADAASGQQHGHDDREDDGVGECVADARSRVAGHGIAVVA